MSKDLEFNLELKASIDHLVAGINRAGEEFSGTLGGMGRTAETTGTKVESALGQLGMRRHAEIQREIQGVEGAYRDLAASGELTGSELAQAQLKMGQQTRALREETNSWGKSLGAMKVELAAAGAAIYGITRTLGGAARSSSEFQTALAEVSTLLDDTSQMDALRKSVEQLSLEFGGDVVTNSKALYQIISAGTSDAAAATELLTQANKLAVGGVTDVATAADGLTSILNAYGDRAGSAEQVSDALFTAMKGGKTTIGELSGSIGKVAPIAAQAGAGLEELLAGVSALTKGGVETSQAMTQMQGILAAVVKPTKQAADLAEELGIQFNTAALRSQGLAGWLEHVREKTGGNEEAMAQLFGRVEALSGVFALTGSAAESFSDILAEMEGRAGATDEAVGKMLDTPAARAARFEQAMASVQRALGDAVTALSPLLDGLTALVNRFNDLSPTTRAWVVGLTAAAVALPPLLLAVGKLATALNILRLALLANAGGFAALAAGTGTAIKAIYAKIVALKGLRAAMMSTGIGALAVGAGYLASKLLDASDAAAATTEGVEDLADAAQRSGDTTEQLGRAMERAAEAGEEMTASLAEAEAAAGDSEQAIKDLQEQIATAGAAADQAFAGAAESVDDYRQSAGRAGQATGDLRDRSAEAGATADQAFTGARRTMDDYRQSTERAAAAKATLRQESEAAASAVEQIGQAQRGTISASRSLADVLTDAGWSAAEAAEYSADLTGAYQGLTREAEELGRAMAGNLRVTDRYGRQVYRTMGDAAEGMRRYLSELDAVDPALVSVADNVRRLDRSLTDLDGSTNGAAKRTADLEQRLLQLTATEEEIAAARADREREQIGLEIQRHRVLAQRAELLRDTDTAEQHRAETAELQRQLQLLDRIQAAETEQHQARAREREQRETATETERRTTTPTQQPGRTVRIELAAGGRTARLDLPEEQADALESLLKSLEMGQLTVQ